MIEKILYNTIPVRSIKSAISWFERVLGFDFIWYMEEENLAQLNLPSGDMLFLMESTDDTNANFTINGKEQSVIGFQTKDMDKLYLHLVQNGVKVEEIVDDGEGNLFLNFYDPDGNLFNVQCDKINQLHRE